MKKNPPLSKEIEDIIQNPSTRWPAFNQALINASDACMLAVNDQGIIFLSNTMAEEKLGISPRIKLKHVLPELDERIDEAIIRGIAQTDFKLRVGPYDFMVSIHPLKIGKDQVGVICALNESTAFENVVKKMHFFQNMSRELDAIINSSSDGLFVCDAKANVIRMNPASERIHNVREKELIGRNMKELIDEGFIDSSAALQASESKKIVTLLQNKDNRKLISIGTPVFDEQEELIRVVVSERDITQIDQLQHELEEQASIKNQLQNQLRQIQVAELKNNQIIARSRSMLEVIDRAYKVSSVDSSVLITGESGVGKGVIVNLIHNNSDRAGKPLIRINCGAIPETLIESELFGYEAGAFTGARSSGKPGSLELANHGSIFLDEIGELPLTAQVKLLRFLENGRVDRLGGSKAINVDARILAATHRDLKKMVAEGTFRHDLYYRLNVIPISIPSLRDRSDCILPLLRHYVEHFAGVTGTRKRLGREALDSLLAYSYPGNVRELMNICERMVVMSETEVINVSDLPGDVARCSADTPVTLSVKPEEWTLAQTLEYVERQVLIQAVKKYKNQINVSKALGVSQPTIARRLKKYNIRGDWF